VADPTDFTDDENWSGGHYELAIQLGRRDSESADTFVVQALEEIWGESALVGCYRDRWTSRDEQPRVDAKPLDISEPGRLYGLASVPGIGTTVCQTTVVRETEADGLDWVDLGLPLGALGRVDDRVGPYPFGNTSVSGSWRGPVDDWLAGVAQRLYAAVPFLVALIGFAVSGEERDFSGEAPVDRPFSYVVPTGRGAEYFPPTQWV
jgi:hypothetical protein